MTSNLLKTSIFFLMFVLLSSLVLAQTQSFGELYIVYPKTMYYEFENNLNKFHVHAFDKLGNLLNSTTYSCTAHVYDNANKHVFEGLMSTEANTIDKELILNTTILYKTGDYTYTIWCIKGTDSGAISGDFTVTMSGKKDVTDPGAKWLAIVVALVAMTALTGYVAGQIKDKQLNPTKIAFFILTVVNSLFLGVVAYVISLNPYDPNAFRPLGLAYSSINLILILGFVWNYGFVMLARIYEKNKDRWVNSFQEAKR